MRLRLVSLILVVWAGLALWQLRIVQPIGLPQDVGATNADLYTLYYPLYSFFYHGKEFMPPWNPYQLAGTPASGYLAGGLYYPPHLLYALIPVHRAMGVLAALHIVLAGVGTWLLARHLGLSMVAALLTAVGFMSNESLVGEHLRLQYLEGLSWIPFAALSIRHLLISPTACSIAGVGFVVALQFMTGDAQIVCYEAYCSLILAATAYLLMGVTHHRRHAFRVVLAALAAAIVAMLVAMVQLLPTLEVVAKAVRGYGGLTMAQTLPPSPSWGFVRHAATSSGLLVLLAVASILAPTPERRVLVAIAITGTVAAGIGCGSSLYTAVFYHLPGVALFRLPQHILVISALAMVVLAGFGLDALRAWGPLPGRVATLAVMIALGMALRDRLGTAWVCGLVTAVAAVTISAVRGRAVTFAALLLLGLVTGERFLHTSNAVMIPAANDDAFFAEPPVVTFLRDTVGFDRVLVIKNWRDRFPLMEKFGSLHGISVVQDYEPLTPHAYHQFLGDLESTNPDKPLFWGRFVAHPIEQGWRALDLLSTKYVVADPTVGWVPTYGTRFRLLYRDADAVVYQNMRALPRAQVIDAYQVIADDAAALNEVLHGTFDPRREVILNREPARGEADERSDAPAAARIVSRTATTVTVEASTPRRGLLLLNDLYWPGWTASVDGHDTPLYRANMLFRAVALPAGAHTVSFSYADTELRLGLVVSLSAGAVCIALMLWGRREWRP